MIKLAIDAMGGDYAPEEIVKGVNLAIEKYNDLELVLYGKPEEIKKYFDEKDIIFYKSTSNFGEIKNNDQRIIKYLKTHKIFNVVVKPIFETIDESDIM